MVSIFVVTTGEYSNYNIEGIFSTKELAKEYICSDKPRYMHYEYHIEEYEIGKPGCIKIIGINNDGREYPIGEWFNTRMEE